jgi:hypothetical protein
MELKAMVQSDGQRLYCSLEGDTAGLKSVAGISSFVALQRICSFRTCQNSSIDICILRSILLPILPFLISHMVSKKASKPPRNL